MPAGESVSISSVAQSSLTVASPTVAPVSPDQRIAALDTIRGFALLGILLMNILGVSMPRTADNPALDHGATGLNLFTWCFITVLADGKMRAIFSLCFGASVCLLIDRLSRKGAALDAADIHYRRMLWLLCFGLIHAYLIWSGDILFPYAIAGLFLYPLRKLSPRVLLIAAGIMVLVMTGDSVRYYYHTVRQHREYIQIQADEKGGKKLTTKQEDTKKEWEDAVKELTPSVGDLKEETAAHLGGYRKLLVFRAGVVYRGHSYPIYFPGAWFDIWAFMLAGMALLKLGVLEGKHSTAFYAWMAALSFALALPANLILVWWPIRQHYTVESWRFTDVPYEIARFSAFGYMAILLLIMKAEWMRPVTRTLAYVGRTAFSNYILTSLICTTIFEGYGLGWFGKLQRYQLYGVVLGVWAAILIVSPFWLQYFQFGPLEWLWRSLTSWRKQPFRIAQQTQSDAGRLPLSEGLQL